MVIIIELLIITKTQHMMFSNIHPQVGEWMISNLILEVSCWKIGTLKPLVAMYTNCLSKHIRIKND